MKGVSDIEFLKIAKGIGGTNHKIMSLGIHLGFSNAKVRDYLATNKTDFESFPGTLNMLYSWKESTPKEHQRAHLKKALLDAELAEIAECISEAHGEGSNFILHSYCHDY